MRRPCVREAACLALARMRQPGRMGWQLPWKPPQKLAEKLAWRLCFPLGLASVSHWMQS